MMDRRHSPSHRTTLSIHLVAAIIMFSHILLSSNSNRTSLVSSSRSLSPPSSPLSNRINLAQCSPK